MGLENSSVSDNSVVHWLRYMHKALLKRGRGAKMRAQLACWASTNETENCSVLKHADL